LRTDGSTAAIGHTRWATHGRPTTANAHPHTEPSGRVAVVHNGIIENYAALKAEMSALGNRFSSDTDTEVIAHLVAYYLARDERQGANSSEALVIVAARKASPLVVAVTAHAGILASDVAPIVAHTKEVIYLEDDDVAVLSPGAVRIRRAGREVSPRSTTVSWDAESAERGGHPHYMLKEICEQPVTLRGLANQLILDPGLPGDPAVQDDEGTAPVLNMEGARLTPELIRGVERVVLVAQGTAYHAAMIGRNLIERVARIPAMPDIGSDFRYRDPIIDKSVLVIAVSQSGETADTLGAVRIAKEAGCPVLGIVNVVGSTIARECDGIIYIKSGPEIGVASTKAFTGMIAALYAASIHMGLLRDVLPFSEARRRVNDLLSIGQRVEEVQGREKLPFYGPRYRMAPRHGRRLETERSELHSRRGV
jgi:glucosamine--fructose-6-phosphate aminotransferase (isomerizing)